MKVLKNPRVMTAEHSKLILQKVTHVVKVIIMNG